MTAPPPLPPDDDAPPRGPAVFRGATWGPLEVALGIPVTLLLLIMGVGLLGQALLSLGFEDESLAFRYSLGFVYELTLLIVPFAIARMSRGGAAALGLTRSRGRALAEGAGIGLLLFLILLAIEVILPRIAPEIGEEMLKEQREQMTALEAPWPLLVLLAVGLAPFCEELLFRGFLFGGLRRRLDFGWASGISAAIFAAVHGMPWSTIPLFLVGLGCALAYERHRSLFAPVAAHVTFNGKVLIAYFMTAKP